MSSWVNLLEILYPIGAVYYSIDSTSPASIIGGSWTQITNAVIRAGTSEGYSGSDTHTITIAEMPPHNHDTQGYWRVATGSYDTMCLTRGMFHSDPRDVDTMHLTGGASLCRFFQGYTTCLCGAEQPNISLFKGEVL